MKRENTIVYLVILGIVAYLAYPHLRGGFAYLRGKFGSRNSIVTGTANSGNDSSGVLTQACEG